MKSEWAFTAPHVAPVQIVMCALYETWPSVWWNLSVSVRGNIYTCVPKLSLFGESGYRVVVIFVPDQKVRGMENKNGR